MCPQFPDTNTDTTRRLKQYPAEFNPMSRKQRQHDGTSELRRRYQLIATGQVAPSPLRRLQSTIPRTEISPTRIQLLTHPSSRTPYDGHANLATLLANYATAADTVIEALLPHENTVTTQSSKARSLQKFAAYCHATGLNPQFDPPRLSTSGHKRRILQEREDDTLCSFALYLALYGYSLSTVSGTISHIRTVYQANFRAHYGIPPAHGRGKTERFLASLKPFWPKKCDADDDRLPMTPEHITTIYNAATTVKAWDMAAAALTCWAGLFRLGELLRGNNSTYDPRKHLSEADIVFFPSFRDPTHVTIHLGATKADRDATKAKRVPRRFAVTQHFQCTGRALLQMIRRRYNLRPGTDWIPSNRPLFQSRSRGQLKARTLVNFHKKALRAHGMTKTTAALYTGHSYRIGAAARSSKSTRQQPTSWPPTQQRQDPGALPTSDGPGYQL
jgi:hypothetical protein